MSGYNRHAGILSTALAAIMSLQALGLRSNSQGSAKTVQSGSTWEQGSSAYDPLYHQRPLVPRAGSPVHLGRVQVMSELSLEDRTALVLLATVILGFGFWGIEWLAKRGLKAWHQPEILPPPDRSARRLHLEEWEDTE